MINITKNFNYFKKSNSFALIYYLFSLRLLRSDKLYGLLVTQFVLCYRDVNTRQNSVRDCSNCLSTFCNEVEKLRVRKARHKGTPKLEFML